jgi:hypothetical protein
MLQDNGFDRVGTASYDVEGMNTDSIVEVLQDLLAIFRNPPGGGELDHLWIYVDQPTPN